MRKLWFVSSCFAILMIVVPLLACGGGANKRLRSIVVSPTTAIGQAQFVATGVYTDGSKLSPLPVLWSEHNPWSMISVADEIGVRSDGKVSCMSAAGTFPVTASAPIDPLVPISKMGPTTPQVSGSATITCP